MTETSDIVPVESEPSVIQKLQHHQAHCPRKILSSIPAAETISAAGCPHCPTILLQYHVDCPMQADFSAYLSYSTTAETMSANKFDPLPSYVFQGAILRRAHGSEGRPRDLKPTNAPSFNLKRHKRCTPHHHEEECIPTTSIRMT